MMLKYQIFINKLTIFLNIINIIVWNLEKQLCDIDIIINNDIEYVYLRYTKKNK